MGADRGLRVSAGRRPGVWRPLFGSHAGRRDDLGPLRDLGFDEGSEFLRSERRRLRALRVEALHERRLANGLRPKLVYTIPDHQNPAGVSLAAERRSLLVDLARRHGFLIVEDVAYRELSFSGESLHARSSPLWARRST